MNMKLRALTLALAAAFAASALAQSSLEKMKQMRVASTDLNLPVVPQTGKKADAIRNKAVEIIRAKKAAAGKKS